MGDVVLSENGDCVFTGQKQSLSAKITKMVFPEFPLDQNLISREEWENYSREDRIMFNSLYKDQTFIDGWRDGERARRSQKGKERIDRFKRRFVEFLGRF